MKTQSLKIVFAVLTSLAAVGCAVDDIQPQDPKNDPLPQGQKQLPIVYDQGPTKRMEGNQLLDSLSAITGHNFGSYDITMPDPDSIRTSTKPNLDKLYYGYCFTLQGCREHRVPATEFPQTYGVPEVVLLDNLGRLACLDVAAFGMFPARQDPDANTALGATDAEKVTSVIINYQYKAFMGVLPDAEQLAASKAYFTSHMAGPETTTAGVSALESAGRGHCRAMISNAKFLYY